MKTLHYLFLSLLLLGNSCKSDDDEGPSNPVDQLPPATQTGANTFGCLLDGEVFLPRYGTNPLDCVYQFYDGGYYFSLQANKRNELNDLLGLGCSTQRLEIFEGETYNFSTQSDGNSYGKYFCQIDFAYTSNEYSGQMTITKLDKTKQIVSGTFYYDVKDCQGTVHQIREGRFDMRYTN